VILPREEGGGGCRTVLESIAVLERKGKDGREPGVGRFPAFAFRLALSGKKEGKKGEERKKTDSKKAKTLPFLDFTI